MGLVLGVDSSTQATKVELRHAEDGTLAAAGRAPHPPTGTGCSETDPEAWWRALAEAVGHAVAGLGGGLGPDDVVAASVAGQQHGMVALDAAGTPLHPAKLWNDTESAPQARALVELQGAPWWSARCGSVPVASFTVTKLAWLAATHPASIESLATVVLPHDWLTGRLAGDRVTDRGDASGTGWWSPRAEAWVPEALGAALAVGYEGAAARAAAAEGPSPDPARWPHPEDLAGRLPRVLGPDEPAGDLTERAAGHLGLPAGTPVGPGTGDNMAAALGVALAPGDVAVSIGTSGTVYAVAAAPTADATGAVAGFADATGRHLPLVCTLNATQVTDAVARLLGVDHVRLDELALAGEAGAGGVVLVPYLAGERTPDRPDATGTLTGLRTDVSREQLARAAVEGVVCGLLDGLDALAAAGVPTTDGRLVLVGGGSRSPAFRQVLADLAGRPVTVPAGEEHVATGAAVQAAAVVGGSTPEVVADAWGLGGGEAVEPDLAADRAAEVRAAYARARG